MLRSVIASSWSRPACARLFSVLVRETILYSKFERFSDLAIFADSMDCLMTTQSTSGAARAAAPASNDNHSTSQSASTAAPSAAAPAMPYFLRGYAERVVQRRAHLMRERELLARPPKSPATDPRTRAADAEPQTLGAKLSVPFNFVLNHFADSHALEKMKEDDAVSLFSGLKRASRSETLQRAFCLPDSHYRTFLSVYNVHLFIMLNEMNRAYKNEYAAKVAEFIFRQAKDDFYKEVKARGVRTLLSICIFFLRPSGIDQVRRAETVFL